MEEVEKKNTASTDKTNDTPPDRAEIGSRLEKLVRAHLTVSTPSFGDPSEEELAKIVEAGEQRELAQKQHFAHQWKFLGLDQLPWVELQTVPKGGDGREKFDVPCYAHVSSAGHAWQLVREADGKAQGVYLIPQKLVSGIEDRGETNTWVKASKGGTSDRDVELVQNIYFDFDSQRARGVSATDDELWHAVRLAIEFYCDLTELFGSENGLAFMFSGNGAHVVVAHAAVPREDAEPLRRELITIAAKLYLTDGAKCDGSVFEPKRLLSVATAMKGKGKSNAQTGRIHREVGFWCAGIERVTTANIERLRDAFKDRAGDNRAVQTPKATPTGQPLSHDSAYDAANSVPIADVYQALGFDAAIPVCPDERCRATDGVQLGGNKNTLKCHHDSCSKSSWGPISLVTKVVFGAAPDDKKARVEAAKWIADKFGTPMPRQKGPGKRESAAPTSDDVLQQVLRSLRFARSPIGRIFGEVDDAWWPVDSNVFLSKVARVFNQTTNGKLVSKDAIDKAMLPILGSDVPQQDVPIRVAAHGNGVVLDIGDSKGRCIDVTPGSVRLLDKSPVPFFRPATLRALPLPEIPRDAETARKWLGLYRELLGLDDGHNWHACVAWQLQVLRQASTYTILRIKGAKGAGKTWKIKLLRRPLDPRRPELTSLPKDGEGLALVAENAHVIAFDNLRKIKADMSDELCRLATFGGSEKRTLYETRGLSSFEAARPMILAGISDSVTEADLLDRTITVTFTKPTKRKKDEDLEREFMAMWPKVLGALCFVLSQGLVKLATGTVTISDEVRMQEPCLWAAACEDALGLEAGTMERVYIDSAEEASDVARERPAFGALLEWIERAKTWQGPAKALLAVLREEMTDPVTKKVKTGAPETERGVRSMLDMHTHELVRAGVVLNIEKTGRGAKRRSVVTLTHDPNQVDHVGENVDHVAVSERDPKKPNDAALGSRGSRGSLRGAQSLGESVHELALGADGEDVVPVSSFYLGKEEQRDPHDPRDPTPEFAEEKRITSEKSNVIHMIHQRDPRPEHETIAAQVVVARHPLWAADLTMLTHDAHGIEPGTHKAVVIAKRPDRDPTHAVFTLRLLDADYRPTSYAINLGEPASVDLHEGDQLDVDLVRSGPGMEVTHYMSERLQNALMAV